MSAAEVPSTAAGTSLWTDARFHAAGCQINLPDRVSCDCGLPGRIREAEEEALMLAFAEVRRAIEDWPVPRGRQDFGAHGRGQVLGWLDMRESESGR